LSRTFLWLRARGREGLKGARHRYGEEGKLAKNERRREIAARRAARPAEPKEIVRPPSATEEERLAARRELRGQPRDASATRVRNRDRVDGRPRGCFRAFGLSRVNPRDRAHSGYLPGVRESSW
jgi:small subunit ribosomal protein S14